MKDLPMNNPYEDGIDFAQLAKDDPDFAKILNSKSRLDFSDQASFLQLTKSLLKRDFDLTIELPDDRLCPPVPNRLNYLLFIDTLLRTSRPISLPSLSRNLSVSDAESLSYLSTSDPAPILGLDIGTGASAIYPLLACRSSRPNANWSFLATDIDAKSILYARKNIISNNLQDRITLIKSDSDVPSIPLGKVPGATVENLDFVMCNPPFYGSVEEMEKGREDKDKPPGTVCTGSKNEMVTAGGEVAFISHIIDESLVFKTKVQWYTSMVGKLSSLVPLIERLKDEGCTNWAVKELIQGTKTRRWVLAWSWQDWRPSMSVSRGVGAGTLGRRYLPFPNEYSATVDQRDAEEVGRKVDEACKALSWTWTWVTAQSEGVGFSQGDVWSRSVRRKLHRSTAAGDGGPEEPRMKFGIRITTRAVNGKTEVLVRWLKGGDSVLFESFCGMVKRTVEGAPKAKRKAEDITS